jgi:mutual gliding-motility protein MglA
MAVFNAAKREIDLKIVYYGPAMCGKTTNVQCIHKMLTPQQRGDLMSLATKDDRTLFFDFLPIELGDVRGFKTRFHIYTVPGQVYYGLTRRAVLTGADGVVFVADSQTNKLQDNLESLKDLADNLKFYKKDIGSFPFVLQYNKRDLPHVASVEELNSILNLNNVPAYESSALSGMGVVETLTGICKLVLKQMDSGTAKKKPAQPAATVSSRPSAEPPETAADDKDIKIFSEVPPAPLTATEPESLQPDQTLMPVAPLSEQKQPLRLSPTEPSSLPFDDSIPSAAPSFEKSYIPEPDGVYEKPAPAFDTQSSSSEVNSDVGLSFDDEETLLLEEEAVQEPELSFDDEDGLSFDDEETLVLEEEAVQEPELSFDDEAALVLEEEAVQEPELSFEDEEGLTFDEEEGQESELSFEDNPAVLAQEKAAADMSEPELSFEEDDSGLAIELVSDASASIALHDDTAGFALEEPSLEFEEPSGGEGFTPRPVLTPDVEGLSIVTCGQPQKISETSISLPITIRLNKNDTEHPLTITISLGDIPFK